MVFSKNFQAAYQTDPAFKTLLREDLIDLAHFEQFNKGRAFTLVECRKFYTYLRQGQDRKYDPRDPSCPSDPFDGELEIIQQNVCRRFPEGSKRDPLFSEFADLEVEADTLAAEFDDLYTIYQTAYQKLRRDQEDQGYPLGIIHFDEKHKSPGTDNIFDYMGRISSIRSIPRQLLVDHFGLPVARLHRTLLLKAEMRLLSGAHAILPTDLAPYQSSVLTNVGAKLIDETESNYREEKIDLSSVNTQNLASLNLDDVLEIRRAGEGFFDAQKRYSCDANQFDLIWNSLASYCQHINLTLGFRGVTSSTSKVINSIRLVQGKTAQHTTFRDACMALTFKVAGAVSHTLTALHTGSPEVGAAVEVSLQGAERMVRSALGTSPMASRVDEVKAKLVISTAEHRDKLMYYE